MGELLALSMPLFARQPNYAALKTNFDLKNELGSGAFSKVMLASYKDKPDKTVAIKCIDRKSLKGFEDALENEITVLQKLLHPNIVQLYETLEDAKYVYLVMQVVTGGELFDRIVERGQYTERDASDLLKQILEAVDFMHQNGVTHRDLKPENLLYYSQDENSKIMVTDFGMAKMEGSAESLASACGTPGYVAPEILAQREYGSKVDVWSIGVIAYILLCGYPPFCEDNDAILYVKVMKGDWQFDSPYWDEISDSAKDFVSHLMCLDEDERYSCAEALQHPWIAGDAALDIDISGKVGVTLKKTLARQRWKKAMNATSVIARMRLLGLGAQNSTEEERAPTEEKEEE